MNLCSACGLNFGSVSAFDRHRIGDFPQTGPVDYLDRIRAGLVDGLEPYSREMGRRCLEEGELPAKGFAQNSSGGWSIASSLADAQRLNRNRRGA